MAGPPDARAARPERAPGESLVRPPRLRAVLATATSRRASAARPARSPARSELGNLTVIYDAQPDLDRGRHRHRVHRGRRARYEAYGWHVQVVDWTNGEHDVRRGRARAARRDPRGRGGHRQAVADRAAHDHRAGPRPTPQGTEQGPRLRARRRGGRGHQEDPGLRPGADLRGARRASSSTPARLRDRGKAAREPPGTREYDAWSRPSREPTRRSCTGSRPARCPTGSRTALPTFEADAKGVATRVASGKVINAIAPRDAGAVGRLGRPRGLQQHHDRGCAVVPAHRTAPPRSGRATPTPGRVLHFGIREHGMGAIMNGIAAHGGTRVFGGTFLTFSDYMRGAVRVAALMAAAGHLRVDPRLHRPRRGRTHAPADRAPGRAARHARARRRPPGRRQRDRRLLADGPRAHRPARRRWP